MLCVSIWMAGVLRMWPSLRFPYRKCGGILLIAKRKFPLISFFMPVYIPHY
jgi:hypothetical protein